MESTFIKADKDIAAMRTLLQKSGEQSMLVDFEEMLLLDSIRAACRLWWHGESLAGFALVDGYNNLWFELDEAFRIQDLEREVVAWGAKLMSQRNSINSREDTLDVCLSARNDWQLGVVERAGFSRQAIEALSFRLGLADLGPEMALPVGYVIRPAIGEVEVDDLVSLHRQAFGTEHMDRDQRLAIMRAPGYVPALDLVALTPAGKMAGFCIGSLDTQKSEIGYTDPIGVIPTERHKGLAPALVDRCLRGLKNEGAREARLGTSSDNVAMRDMAEKLGFKLLERRCWYSLEVGDALKSIIKSFFEED